MGAESDGDIKIGQKFLVHYGVNRVALPIRKIKPTLPRFQFNSLAFYAHVRPVVSKFFFLFKH